MNWYKQSQIKLKHKDDPNVSRAISAINSMGMANSLNPRERVIDGVKVAVRPYDEGMLWLTSIEAMEKGKGHGTAVLRKILDTADQYNVVVYLDPMPFGDTNTKQLVKWYTGMGFVRGTGYFGAGMIHYPKGKEM